MAPHGRSQSAVAFLHNLAEAEAEDGDVHISQQVEDLEVAVPAQDTTVENTTENGDGTNKYQEENVSTSGVTTVENTTENGDDTSKYQEENVSDADGTEQLDTSYASDRFVPESIDVKKLPSSHQHRISFASSVGSASDCAPNSTWNARKTRKSQIGKLGLKLHNRRQSDCSVSSTDYSARKSMWTNLAKDDDVWDDDDEEEKKEISFEKRIKLLMKKYWINIYVSSYRKTVVCKSHPWILCSTAIIFAILLLMGLYFVLKLADEEEQTKKGDAIALAIQTGDWFSDTLDNALLPLFTLSQFVQQLEMFHTLPEEVGAAFGSGSMPFLPPNEDGEFTHRNITGTSCTDPEKIARFEQIAAGIKRDAKMQGVLVNLQVAPLAMVCYAYPIVNTEDFEPPKVLNSTQIIGLDNLSDPSRVSAAEETVATSDEVVIAGPLSLRQCPDCDATVKTAFIAWLTIDALTDDQIIKAKGSYHKKWGFATAIINWAELVDRSDINGLFADKGLHYQLTRTDRTYNQETNQIDVKVNVLAGEEDFELEEDNYVSVDIETANKQWNIKVGSENGFAPSWKNGAIAGAVIVAFVLSLMSMTIFIENQTHHDLLREMLPPHALRKINQGRTCVEKYSIATVFFSDIVGYTTMSSEMSAIQVMKMLNEFYTEVDKIATEHSVCKIQTIGDAYMVTGGVPDRCLGPEGAQKVALFAIDFLEFAEKFRTSEGARVYIRAGINSGPLVAGVVGTKRPQYTVFGDTVNAAARMESTSEKMRIQCTDMTYRLLRDSKSHEFNIEHRGEIEVKGKGHMSTWYINGAIESKAESDFDVDDGSVVINDESHLYL